MNCFGLLVKTESPGKYLSSEQAISHPETSHSPTCAGDGTRNGDVARYIGYAFGPCLALNFGSTTDLLACEFCYAFSLL
jgi:hypothetical protein